VAAAEEGAAAVGGGWYSPGSIERRVKIARKKPEPGPDGTFVGRTRPGPSEVRACMRRALAAGIGDQYMRG
jgi:hypothetical protein